LREYRKCRRRLVEGCKRALGRANEMVRDRASTFVLGLAGIQPDSSPSLAINIEVKAGSVIDLTDDAPPMRTIPHV
jgi:hypothetical protein